MPRAKKLMTPEGTLYGLVIRCPACDDFHVLQGWNWNQDLELPTFTPSLMVTYYTGDKVRAVCHSHITDGRIAYCPDSTHELKGQTVDLPEVNHKD